MSEIIRARDLFTAFLAGMVVLALLLRGIEIKRVVVVEKNVDNGATDTKPPAPLSEKETIPFARASSG